MLVANLDRGILKRIQFYIHSIDRMHKRVILSTTSECPPSQRLPEVGRGSATLLEIPGTSLRCLPPGRIGGVAIRNRKIVNDHEFRENVAVERRKEEKYEDNEGEGDLDV